METSFLAKTESDLFKSSDLYRNKHELSLKPELKKIVEVIYGKEPKLSMIEIRTFVPVDEFDAGGYYDFEVLYPGTEQETVVPLIFISEGDPELLRPLLDIRKDSIRINSELLGIAPQQMTPQLLWFFILAHEFGHIKDFISNYQEDPDLKGVEALQEMYSHRDEILSKLPVSNMSPTNLARELSLFDSLDQIMEKFPEIKNHPKFQFIKTKEDLFRIQEEEYRNSPPERYADEFAARVLIESSEKLGIASMLFN